MSSDDFRTLDEDYAEDPKRVLNRILEMGAAAALAEFDRRWLKPGYRTSSKDETVEGCKVIVYRPQPPEGEDLTEWLLDGIVGTVSVTWYEVADGPGLLQAVEKQLGKEARDEIQIEE